MCTPSTLEWVEQNLTSEEVQGKRVLDIGSFDVNGSLRSVVSPLKPGEYIGVDLRPGPGVDVVCAAEDLIARFGVECFDLVLSSSTFEHIRYWKQALSNMKQVCKPNGLILIIVPSKWPFHAYPNDYWRYESYDMERIFADCDLISLHEDDQPNSLVYLKARKPVGLREIDLSAYRLFSIISGQRVQQIEIWHYFTINFLRVFWRDMLRPGVDRWVWVVKMGVRHRIIDPITSFYRRTIG
jgi:SAM-dependent methyltransferase